MGWCNETASAAVKRGGNSLNRDERVAAYAEFQTEFAKDMISLPLFNRIEVFAANKDFATYQPGPGESYPTYNAQDWEIPGKDTIILAFTQEPATLFTLIESAYVASLANYLVAGQPYSSLNYEYSANHFFEELPTIDNGGAVLNEVEPAAGDMIADADGNIVEAAEGIMVRNSAGETVEWAAGTKMNQLVVTFTVVDGLVWSDGEPFKAADMELGPKINCYPESGNVSFTLCEATVKWEYTDTSQTRTWVPGYTPAEYMIYYDLGYPSHQVLSDGRKLADVPASEWSTLPEIAEKPLGFGPYVVSDWVKGQQIVFEANPLFYKGEPKTKTVIVKFVADTNQAVAQLFTGEVDAVGSETLGAGAEVETVVNECKKPDTTIVCFNEASATWEHIDFNLFTR
jgi:ABC-type transport system substrate-binding protein